MTTERVLETYRPVQELARCWPGWRVLRTPDLPPGCEEFYRGIRLAVVGDNGDRDWTVAHVIAHLDLDHDGDSFTQEQERDADYLAGVRLDVEWDDISVDGEPTVVLPPHDS